MVTLHIEHGIGSFEVWKAAFDRDPVGRQKSGVRQYRVWRPEGNAKQIVIDLDFDTVREAQAFHEAMRRVWSTVELSPGLERAGDANGNGPQARILEHLESRQY
jgi:hypothetical protein